ncbi:MAG: Hsp20/alpha crystallin family protein [Paludibacteraceae bacterium]|nr:Hsp20/alpha crystallin family protein [Paludibacteraceae bacterium]
MLPTRKNQNWIPSIFNEFFDNDVVDKWTSQTPAVNVYEDEKQFRMEIAAPGMVKEDFHVHIGEDNTLVVSVEKKTNDEEKDEHGRYLRREFSASKFSQAFILPDEVDRENISAKVENGVLTVALPKKTEEQKEKALRQIEIQ